MCRDFVTEIFRLRQRRICDVADSSFIAAAADADAALINHLRMQLVRPADGLLLAQTKTQNDSVVTAALLWSASGRGLLCL